MNNMSATLTTSKPRIDKLTPGSVVSLVLFTGSKHESLQKAMFMGIEGEGEDRRAKFLFRTGGWDCYDVEIYRYNGKWAWGSSADRISLDSVIITPSELLS